MRWLPINQGGRRGRVRQRDLLLPHAAAHRLQQLPPEDRCAASRVMENSAVNGCSRCGTYTCACMHAGIIADLGQTPNSSVTISHLVANDPGVSLAVTAQRACCARSQDDDMHGCAAPYSLQSSLATSPTRTTTRPMPRPTATTPAHSLAPPSRRRSTPSPLPTSLG